MHGQRAKHPEGYYMNDIKIGKASVSIWALLAFIGAIFAFISFFLAMTKFSYSYGIGELTTKAISGIDMISNKWDGNDYSHFTFWKIMPLLTMLAALATIVLGILPVFGVNNSGVKTAFMVCAIVTFVLGLLVFICSAGKPIIESDYYVWNKVQRQVGAYFALIGGIVAGLGAVLDKLGVKI